MMDLLSGYKLNLADAASENLTESLWTWPFLISQSHGFGAALLRAELSCFISVESEHSLAPDDLQHRNDARLGHLHLQMP